MKTLHHFSILGLIASLIVSLTFSGSYPLAYAADGDELTSSESTIDPKVAAEQSHEAVVALHAAFESGGLHPLDTFRLLQQRKAKATPSKLAGNLSLVVKNAGTEVARLSLRRDNNRGFHLTPPGSTFELWSQNQLLYEFTMPIRSIGVFEGRVVFLDQDSFINATGVHNVQFIDLPQMAYNVGRTELPVFRIPVKTDSETDTLIQTGTLLHLGKANLSAEHFQLFGHLQTMAFDLTANLVNPSSLADAGHLVADFEAFSDRILAVAAADIEQQVDASERFLAQYRPLAAQLAQQTLPEYQTRGGQLKSLNTLLGPDSPINPEGSAATALKNQAAQLMQEQKLLLSISQKNEVGRQWLGRLQLLWQRLTLPKPDASPNIKEALAMVAAGLDPANAPNGQLTEGALQLIHSRWIKFGVPSAAAAIFGATYPEIATDIVAEGLNLTRSALETILGKASDGAEITWDSATSVLKGFNPYVVSERYFSGENIKRLGVGLLAGGTTLFLGLSIPMVVANAHKLYNDLTQEIGLRQAIWRFQPLAYLRQFTPGRFIDRENQFSDEHFDRLAKAAAEKRKAASGDGEEVPAYTDEQQQQAQVLVNDLREKQRSWFGKMLSGIRLWPWTKKTTGPEGKQRIATLFGALTHACFSAASFYVAGQAYTNLWNNWFLMRTMVWHPVVASSLFYYPNYLSTAMAKGTGLNTPSLLNGGLRPVWLEYPARAANFFSLGRLESLRAWEAAILPIESAIEREALRRTSIAVLETVDSPTLLKKFVRTNGIDRAGDHTVADFSWAQRRFFREYLTRLKERAMRRFLGELLAKTGAEDGHSISISDAVQLHPLELKARTLRATSELKITTADATRFVSEGLAESDLSHEVSKVVEEGQGGLTRIRDALNFSNLRYLDPKHNRQIARVQSVRRQQANPQAMDRSVRQAMVSFVVDKPMELLLFFICLAGVKEGIMSPIHDEMFSPNSMFYLGTYSFFSGYLANAIIDGLAGPWMKLQMDEQNEGNFDERPVGEDAKKGYLYWLRKQFLRKDKNTWWQNQSHYTKVIIANIPAALTTYLATNLPAMGRLDLDAYLLGYMTSTAIMGLNWKMEQTYEMANGYFAKDIPEALLTTPAAQEYISEQSRRARVKFNLWYKFYENVSGNFLSVFASIQAGTQGPRSLARLLFGGFTPTEWLFSASEFAKAKLGAIPGVSGAIDVCRKLIINNYTDSILPDFPDFKKK